MCLGYRQISSKHRMLARVDVPDVTEALKKELPFSGVEKWSERDKQEHWRRCYSKDRLEGVDEDVMRVLRKICDADAGFGIGSKTVLCIDNSGMESSFDKGIEYVAVMMWDGFIYVYDKLAVLQPCVRERFI